MKTLKGFELDNTPRGTATDVFKEYVNNKTGGQINVSYISNKRYPTEHEIIKAVQIGEIDIHIVGANMLANLVPQFAGLSLPFLTQSFEEGLAVLDGPVGDYLKELGEKQNLKILTDVALGYAQITNSVRPIYSPQDLIGLRMRTPNDFYFIETFKTLGVSVEPIPYTEIYNNLAQGNVDAQFNPLSNILDLNLNEVQDYLAMTNHAFYVAFIIMNKDVFDRFSSDMQQIILEAATKARNAARKEVRNSEEELKEKAKSAFKHISYPEREPFEKATQPLYKKMEKEIGGEMISKIQEGIKDYRDKKKLFV